ncbi:hypothetical protein VKS41_005811 [Umbelopsis sp. WA50703]
MELDSNEKSSTSPFSPNEQSFEFLDTFDFSNTPPARLDSIIISEDSSAQGTPTDPSMEEDPYHEIEPYYLHGQSLYQQQRLHRGGLDQSPSEALDRQFDSLTIPDFTIPASPPAAHLEDHFIIPADKSTLVDVPMPSAAAQYALQHKASQANSDNAAGPSSVFNISWGGNDQPPEDYDNNALTEENMLSSKPLPKPRGIKRHPEADLKDDGSLDEESLKRLRNTHAARRSRLKKFLKVEFLEKQVAGLQAENSKLVLRTAVLDSEKQSMLAKEQEYIRRIKHLEDVVKQQQQKLNESANDSSPQKWLV